MLLFAMKADCYSERSERLLRKLSWLSAVMAELDDWVESRPSSVKLFVPSPRKVGLVTRENLDQHLAREKSD